MPITAPRATAAPARTLMRWRYEYELRSPPPWSTVTWSAVATAPANTTVPEAAARTVSPGSVSYSIPRLPGP